MVDVFSLHPARPLRLSGPSGGGCNLLSEGVAWRVSEPQDRRPVVDLEVGGGWYWASFAEAGRAAGSTVTSGTKKDSFTNGRR